MEKITKHNKGSYTIAGFVLRYENSCKFSHWKYKKIRIEIGYGA